MTESKDVLRKLDWYATVLGKIGSAEQAGDIKSIHAAVAELIEAASATLEAIADGDAQSARNELRAAHADLAGKVRELDENAAVRNALAGKKLYVMHPEHIADSHKPLNEITFGMVMDGKVLFACKQPAKFTQEKP